MMTTDDPRPAYDDLATLVRAIASEPPWYALGSGDNVCFYCGAYEGVGFSHDDDCAYVRARALAAWLPDGTQLH